MNGFWWSTLCVSFPEGRSLWDNKRDREAYHQQMLRMACSWGEDAKNVEGKDFKLFSNLNDAFGDGGFLGSRWGVEW